MTNKELCSDLWTVKNTKSDTLGTDHWNMQDRTNHRAHNNALGSNAYADNNDGLSIEEVVVRDRVCPTGCPGPNRGPPISNNTAPPMPPYEAPPMPPYEAPPAPIYYPPPMPTYEAPPMLPYEAPPVPIYYPPPIPTYETPPVPIYYPPPITSFASLANQNFAETSFTNTVVNYNSHFVEYSVSYHEPTVYTEPTTSLFPPLTEYITTESPISCPYRDRPRSLWRRIFLKP